MVGDGDRGATLELLLAKLLFCGKRKIQILGMSATIPNLQNVATWLGAQTFIEDFRPVPLREYLCIDGKVMDPKMEVVRRVQGKGIDPIVASLCCEVLLLIIVKIFVLSINLLVIGSPNSFNTYFLLNKEAHCIFVFIILFHFYFDSHKQTVAQSLTKLLPPEFLEHKVSFVPVFFSLHC